MPFTQRKIQPVKLARIKVERDYRFDFDIISNWKLVCALKQLGNLAEHADQLFYELSQECQNVINRTQRLSRRVHTLDESVTILDAKSVQVRKYSCMRLVPGTGVCW